MRITLKVLGLVMIVLLAVSAGAQEKKAAPKKAEPKAAAKTEDSEKKLEKKDVPAAVLAAFTKAYPKATVKGYAKETEKGQTSYEVESMEGTIHRDVSYAADGKLLLTEESVEMKDVPAAVREALEKKFPKAKVGIAEKVMDGKTVAYEFHVKTAAGKGAEVKFDPNGKELEL
jgi:hypothetical protein